MRLGIMQPYFMPYLGYLSLIQECDRFILFDTPQFIRHGWIERNRILKANGEDLYIKVPLKKDGRDTAIKDKKINNDINWQNIILSQLGPYKKKAPQYQIVIGLLEKIFKNKTESIVELNKRALEYICQYLEIMTPILVLSELKLDLQPVYAPDEWALNICKAMKADEYYNPAGGMDFFSRDKYQEAGITLKFLEFKAVKYPQIGDQFVPNISIIDVMMFNSVDEIQKMMKNITLHR